MIEQSLFFPFVKHGDHDVSDPAGTSLFPIQRLQSSSITTLWQVIRADADYALLAPETTDAIGRVRVFLHKGPPLDGCERGAHPVAGEAFKKPLQGAVGRGMAKDARQPLGHS